MDICQSKALGFQLYIIRSSDNLGLTIHALALPFGIIHHGMFLLGLRKAKRFQQIPQALRCRTSNASHR